MEHGVLHLDIQVVVLVLVLIVQHHEDVQQHLMDLHVQRIV